MASRGGPRVGRLAELIDANMSTSWAHHETPTSSFFTGMSDFRFIKIIKILLGLNRKCAITKLNVDCHYLTETKLGQLSFYTTQKYTLLYTSCITEIIIDLLSYICEKLRAYGNNYSIWKASFKPASSYQRRQRSLGNVGTRVLVFTNVHADKNGSSLGDDERSCLYNLKSRKPK